MEVIGILNVPPPATNGSLVISNIRVYQYFGAIFRTGVTYEPSRSSLSIGRKRNAMGRGRMMNKREGTRGRAEGARS